jgi:hypothetical protein
MTMYTATSGQEMIISLERFHSMLKSVQCGDTTTLQFVDNNAFQYAIRAWNWVNEHQNHSFILIADDSGCGPDDERAPFLINSVEYDEPASTVHLHGTQKSWEDVAHTFDLEYGTFSGLSAPGSNLTKRFGEWGTSKSFNVPLTTSMNGNIFSEPVGSGTFSLDCTDCGIFGSLDVTFKVRVEIVVPVEISLSIAPRSLHADLGLHLGLSTPKLAKQLSISYSKGISDFPIPAWNFEIPGIGGFATHFKVKVGASLSKVQDALTVDFGAIAQFSDSALAKIDIVNPGDEQFHGWLPSFQAKPFKLSNDIAADVSVYLQWSLGPQITLFGQGVEAALVVKLPDFKLALDSASSAGSVCAKKNEDGVSADLSVGAAIALRAGQRGDLAVSADITDQPVFGGSAPLFKRDLAIEGAEPVNSTSLTEVYPTTDVKIRSTDGLEKRWSLGTRIQLTLWVSKSPPFKKRIILY